MKGPSAEPADGAVVARFRTLLAERLGWTFVDNDTAQAAAVLDQRARELGLTHPAYLRHLGGAGWRDEQPALVAALSITETYFFRHGEQIRALAEAALPERVRARSGSRALRLLSVGCSSGEEAYTLHMVARGVQADPGWHLSTLGLDANPVMLRRARAARYSGWSLREAPEQVRRRWLRPVDGEFEVDPLLRAEVHFRECNVAEPDPTLWTADRYDIVFCRNVLMYLTAPVAADLVRRMTAALAPGGYLFLGHTDTLGGRPDGLETQHTHGTFYYRRTRREAPPPASRHTGPPPAPAPRTGPDRDRIVDLLARERFAEALACVEAGLPDRPEPRDLLLHGVALVQVGRLEAAETVGHRLLALDQLDADAHHLLGVCLEGAAAGDEAAEHYRRAAYLDRTFAMPRLRCGLRLRRQGDARAAAQELSSALDLLRGERDERIVLFGGGFGRASLIGLCRAELDLCGASR